MLEKEGNTFIVLLQEKQLKPSEAVYVRAGDAVAIQYPSGSGIIPYENYPALRSDLQSASFHNVLNAPQRGQDWKPGHVISFTGALEVKRLAAIKVFYDCIEGGLIFSLYHVHKYDLSVMVIIDSLSSYNYCFQN